MMNPRISVVLASFEDSDGLESSLCSVLDQDYDNLQIIVVDGSTQDDTTSHLRHYRKSMDWWIRERADTLAGAINTGLAKVDGDIVAMLEPGHLYLPGTLGRVAEAFKTDTDWLVGNCQRLDENDARIGLCQASCPTSLASLLKHDSGVLPFASSFFARSVFAQVGVMDEQLSVAYDYDFHCRLLAADYRPNILGQVLSARREKNHLLDAGNTLMIGREYVEVARHHATDLAPADRKALLVNCDHRHRIYALAEAELHHAAASSQAVRALLDQQQMAAGASRNLLTSSVTEQYMSHQAGKVAELRKAV